MYDIQLIGSLLTIGMLIYAAMIHGMVYYRLRNHIDHGCFSLTCILIAAYAATNIIALYFITDKTAYLITSKLSSVFVILAIVSITWFASEFLHDKKNIPVRLIIFLLLPFFLLNLVMSHGILWSNIDGIALSPRSMGANIMLPINPEISWAVYGLWGTLASIYLLLVRAAYIAFREKSCRRCTLFFYGSLLFAAGYLFDSLIDPGINHSHFYVSEYIALFFVVIMSLHLSDELRLNALNLEHLVSERTSALNEANTELESFSYSVSHDLRAPLRAIDGFTKAIQDDQGAKLNTEGKNLLDRVLNNVQRMQSMIDAMLKLSNIARKEVIKSEIDLSQMARIIKKHGGKIWAEGKKGEGASFYISLE